MEIKIIILINLILYSIVASQSFSYIISLTNVQQNMTATEYITFRKLTDKNFQLKFKPVIYAAVISNILLLIFRSNHFPDIVFITAALSLLALAADILIALKGNIPVNNIINRWTADHYPADWERDRTKWFRAFYKRQVLNIAGFVLLLTGAIFS